MKPLSFSLVPLLLIATIGLSPMVAVPAMADDDSSEVHKLLWPRTYQDDTTTVLVAQLMRINCPNTPRHISVRERGSSIQNWLL